MQKIILSLLFLAFTNLSYSQYYEYYDAEIADVNWDKPVTSTSPTSLSISVYNYSDNIIETMDIILYVDGEASKTFEWSGFLDYYSYDETIIEVGSYQFEEKSDFEPYEIQLELASPNGSTFNTYTNTSSDIELLNMALAGGIYTVGDGEDFDTPFDATSYASGGGILGDVTFHVMSGTYTKPMEINGITNYSLNIAKAPGETGDVLFEFSGFSEGIEEFAIKDNNNQLQDGQSFSDNALLVRDTDDFSISGFKFMDLSTGYTPLLQFRYSNDITIDNCELIGRSADDGVQFLNSLLSFEYSGALTITNNTFDGASSAIYEFTSGDCNREITIRNNIFRDQNQVVIYLENNFGGIECEDYINNSIIENNTFTYALNIARSQYDPVIQSFNGTTVNGNVLSGFKGDGNEPASSAITIDHDPGIGDDVEVGSNTMTLTDMNGINIQNVSSGKVTGNSITLNNGDDMNPVQKDAIKLEGTGNDNDFVWAEKNNISNENGNGIVANIANTKIYYNDINVSQANPADNNSGIATDDASGYVANNRVRGSNISGIIAKNSSTSKNTDEGLTLCYNSIGVDSPNNPALIVDGGANKGTRSLRNMIYNFGGGLAYRGINLGGPVWTSNQNNLRTTGSVHSNHNGINNNNVDELFQNSGQDENSADVEVEFKDDNSLVPAEFTNDLVFNDPIFDPNGPFANIFEECERFDFAGKERDDAFFVGFQGPEIEITVVQQPSDITDCYGQTGLFFAFLASAEGLPVDYQWYKDGEALEGQTFEGLNLGALEYEMAGVFQCRASVLGVETVWSDKVVLNVLQKVDIITQTGSVTVQAGETANLKVESNAEGVEAPTFNPEIQWWKGDTMLEESDKITGVNSSLLTIRDVQADDFGGDYWVEIVGLCGSVTSTNMAINEAPSVQFDSQPQDITVCENGNFEFTVEASVSGNGQISSYEWFVEGEGQGVNSATFSGTATDEFGEVYCVVTVTPGDYKFESERATLGLDLLPVILDQPIDIDTDAGKDAEFSIAANDDGTYTYEWYKEGDNTVLGNSATLTLTAIDTDDAGRYYCDVTNDCGTVASEFAELIVTASSQPLSVKFAEKFELSNSPNPFNDETTISYTLENNANVQLKISDATGRGLYVMNIGPKAKGQHSITLDGNKLRLSSGVYIYTLIVDGESVTGKMIYDN